MKAFIIVPLLFCLLLLYGMAAFILPDTRLSDQPELSFQLKWIITLIVVYIACFVLCQRILFKYKADKSGYIAFLLVFLLTCPTIESYQRVSYGGEFYGTPSERKTTVNTGEAYNRVSLFGLAVINLFVVKEPKPFEQSYFVKKLLSTERLDAIRYSRTYQIHVTSVVLTLIGFFFIYRYRIKRFIIN
jgi:hypothetical protein